MTARFDSTATVTCRLVRWRKPTRLRRPAALASYCTARPSRSARATCCSTAWPSLSGWHAGHRPPGGAGWLSGFRDRAGTLLAARGWQTTAATPPVTLPDPAEPARTAAGDRLACQHRCRRLHIPLPAHNIVRVTRVTDAMMTAAAAAVGEAATIRHDPHGTLLPDRAQLAGTAAVVASAVAKAAVADAVAPALTDDQIDQAIDRTRWLPRYRPIDISPDRLT